MIYWLFPFVLLFTFAHSKEAELLCPCQIGSKEIQGLIDKMINKAYREAPLMGLAAPQIGVWKKIILVDIAATHPFAEKEALSQMEAFINPEIIWQSEEKELGPETCIATPGICGIVARSQKILVRAYDRKAHLTVQEYTGYQARLFQHEIDHLKGISFPDRVENEAHLHSVQEGEIPAYRLNWAHWPHIFPLKKWLEIKNGNL